MRSRIISQDRLIAAAFFTAFFLYLWLWITPALYFQRQEPAFLLDAKFFHEFLAYPGGLTEYASAFLSQFYSIPWLGALIVTLVVGLICLATKGIFESLPEMGNMRFLYLFPAILLLILHSEYQHPLAASLGLLLSLTCINVYLLVVRWPLAVRLIVYFVLGLVLYYVAAGQFLLYSVMCGLLELSGNDSLWKKAGYVLPIVALTVIVPILSAAYLFVITTKIAYLSTLPIDISYRPKISPYLLYLFFPLVIAVVKLRSLPILKRWIEKIGWSSIAQRASGVLGGRPLALARVLSFCAVAGVAAFFSFDKNGKTLLLVDYYAHNEKWEQVLAIAKQQEVSNVAVVFQTNRALYHLGRLPYEMFSYPQGHGLDGLMLPRPFALSAPLRASDIYLELGLLNEALHWAHEALTLKGPTAWNLERLALVNILKGNTEFAQSCVTLLQRTPLYGDIARTYQHCLVDSLSLSNERARMHSVNVESDILILTHNDPMAELNALLKKNQANKMAFEYLVAGYLLDRRLGQFASAMGHLKDFDYPDIPRHYEEALVLYMKQSGRKDIDLSGSQIKPETLQRFGEFRRIFQQRGREELFKRFGDTYWYYYSFNPGGRKAPNIPRLPRIERKAK